MASAAVPAVPVAQAGGSFPEEDGMALEEMLDLVRPIAFEVTRIPEGMAPALQPGSVRDPSAAKARRVSDSPSLLESLQSRIPGRIHLNRAERLGRDIVGAIRSASTYASGVQAYESAARQASAAAPGRGKAPVGSNPLRGNAKGAKATGPGAAAAMQGSGPQPAKARLSRERAKLVRHLEAIASALSRSGSASAAAAAELGELLGKHVVTKLQAVSGDGPPRPGSQTGSALAAASVVLEEVERLKGGGAPVPPRR